MREKLFEAGAGPEGQGRKDKLINGVLNRSRYIKRGSRTLSN